MKSNYLILKSFIVTILIVATECISYNNLSAQSAYCTVLQQPCDSDGVLLTTVTVASGLIPPINYQYSGFANTISHNNINSYNDTLYNISDQIYNVFISDNYGQTVYISNIPLVLPFTIDPPLITPGQCPISLGSAQFTINGGSMPANVNWYQGTALEITQSLGQYVGSGNPISLPNGSYMATVIDINGCSLIYHDTAIYVYAEAPFTYNITTTNANCVNGSATINNISGGIAPYTYSWINGSNSSTIYDLPANYYTCTITDAQGCSDINYAIVNQSPSSLSANSTITNATCLNNDGSIISFGSGGTPPYSYQYSNGAITQSVYGLLGGNSYYVTVTDAIGCTKVKYNYISTNTPINVNYTTTSCSCSAPTGSANLNISGGTPPYSIIWYTVPQQMGNPISNIQAGTYSFKVTDAVGCIRTGNVVIPYQNTFWGNASSTNTICPSNNGNVFVTANGTNPPFTYLWNTGHTSNSISNLSAGNYSCTVTDNDGCTYVKCTTINSISPLNIGFNVSNSSCIFNNDGSITCVISGGTPPYSYYWSNGQNTSIITGLERGTYWVHVIDANGCSKWESTYVDYDHTTDNCYCTVTGRVFVDINSNCTYDTGEETIEHTMVHCDPFGYSFTNNQGIYSFKVPTGNYTLSEVVQYIYPLAPCQNNVIPLNITASSGCIITNDFANIINPLHDIHLRTINYNHAVPGQNYYQALIIENDGTIPESNIQFSNTHDGQLQYLTTSPVALTQPDPLNKPNWYNINSGFPTLNPGDGTMLLSKYFVSTDIPLATTINFWDTIAYNAPMNNWLTDYTPWNNVNDTDIIVVGPYDPNFKEVSPKGIGNAGYISNSDSVLDFTIHFQNIGNFYAHNVVIIDTLDPNLDISSLRPGFSNKFYITEVSENGIIKFSFNNINLYPKIWDEMLSCGFICYSVKLMPFLNPGSQIKNSADIYFDYNSPIKTNTTLNTIQILNVESKEYNNSIIIYPNPASSEIFINTQDGKKIESIKINDLTGRFIREETDINSDKQKLSISNLAPGIYLLQVDKINGEKVIGKFVKR